MENPKLFFSYSRDDSEFVLRFRLAKDLRSAGVDLWIDQLDIAAGDRWDRAVEDALAAAPCLLVVLSPASVESHNVMDEVSLAFDERKKIVPVLVRECTIPFRLRRLQHIDFTVDYDRGLEEVLKAFKLQPRPGPQISQDGTEREAAISAPRTQQARSSPPNSSIGASREPSVTEPKAGASSLRRSGATRRKYVYGLAAIAGGLLFLLVPRYLDHSNDQASTGGGAKTIVRLHIGSDEDPAAESPAPPKPDPTPPAPRQEARFIPPPPPLPPARPISDGIWDVTMSCPDGSEVNENNASFNLGLYARAFKGESSVGMTQLALGYVNNNTVRLTGYVVFNKSDVSAIDATGKKNGRTFIGLGTFGSNTNCNLKITDRN